jgi:tetratricopeptide (TPR) repeat protein
VDAVIEGAVRKEGNRILVSAHLVDTRQRVQLWSQTYDRDLSNILETQRQIAESIAKSFHLELGATRRALIRQGTRNPEAYDLYPRAAYLLDNDVEQSIEAYHAALRADREYALAWAGLAGAWNRLVDWQMVSPQRARPEAMAAATRALAIDPKLAEAHRAWGVAKLYYERDWDAAGEELLKAEQLDPLFADARW